MKLLNTLLIATTLLLTSCDVKVAQEKNKTTTTTISKFANTKDPVCGMDTDNSYTDTLVHDSKLLGFCSGTCLKEFTKNPKGFVVK